MKKVLCCLGMLTLLLMPLTVLASGVDTLGVVGNIIHKAIEQTAAGDFAGVLYGVIVWAIVRFTQFVLKKVPTKWGPLGVSVIWKLLSFLFGRSVIYYNQKVDKDLLVLDQQAAAKLAKEKMVEHLKKHNPILNIDTSWMK